MSLASRYVPLIVTVPAGTAKAAPQSTAAPVSNVVLNRVELRIPPGHGGLTGFSLQWNGVSIVPFASPAQFIVGDDDDLTFDINEQIGGGLVVVAFNTDAVLPHSFHLRFDVTPFALAASAPAGVVPVPITSI